MAREDVMKLKTEEKKLTKQIVRLEVQKENAYHKFDDKLKTLRDKRFKIELRISHIEQLRKKNCHHDKDKYGRREWANSRDDASFSTYVACGNCSEILWDECHGPRGGYG